MRRSPYCTPPDEDAYAPAAAAYHQLPPPHPHMGAQLHAQQQPAMLHLNNNHHSENHLPPHMLARDRWAPTAPTDMFIKLDAAIKMQRPDMTGYCGKLCLPCSSHF